MRNRIKSAALKLFSEKGFYNTGIRDVASTAGCSLPTMYYYYKSKDGLFDTVVCEEYEKLNEQISDQIPEGLPLLDTYYFMVMQRRMLSPENKMVFKLALKTLMGIEGSNEARERLQKWDEAREAREKELINKEAGGDTFTRHLLRTVSSMLQGAVLFDDGLTNEDIKAELELVFKLV